MLTYQSLNTHNDVIYMDWYDDFARWRPALVVDVVAVLENNYQLLAFFTIIAVKY